MKSCFNTHLIDFIASQLFSQEPTIIEGVRVKVSKVEV